MVVPIRHGRRLSRRTAASGNTCCFLAMQVASKNLEDASMALDVHGAQSLPDDWSEIARRHRSHGGADFYVVHLFLREQWQVDGKIASTCTGLLT